MKETVCCLIKVVGSSRVVEYCILNSSSDTHGNRSREHDPE